MMWHAAEGMGWWMLWGGLMMVLFWGVILGFIAWFLQTVGGRRGAGRTDSASSMRNAFDIAKQRYAEGDISRVEFEQLREDLEGPPHGSSVSGVAGATPTALNTER